jgi:parallel beta-helix repeat protein
MKRLTGLSFVLGLLLVISTLTAHIFIVKSGETPRNQRILAISENDNERILINDNSDFSEQGWYGSGTLEDPYIIQDLVISSDYTCIEIRNTTAYFEIRNCTISADTESLSSGIYFYKVENGIIQDCLIRDHARGVFISSSRDCILINNTAIGNSEAGFLLSFCENCQVMHSTAKRNLFAGFDALYCQYCSFTDNIASRNLECGIYLELENCEVINNTLVDNDIRLDGSRVSYWLHDISGNMLNGKSVKFYRSINSEDIDASSYGEVILADCTDISVADGNFSRGGGIQLGHCSTCDLTGNTMSNSNLAFKLQGCTSCVISDNMITNSSNRGVFLSDCEQCTLTDNSVSHSKYGFDLRYTDDTVTENNVASKNEIGFHVRVCRDITFTANTIAENENGFILAQSFTCVLEDNIFIENGLSLAASNMNEWIHEIRGNTVNGRSLGYFVDLEDSVLNGRLYGQIVLVNCRNVVVMDAMFVNVSIGIQLAYSPGCNLTNNNVTRATYSAYHLFHSENCILKHNFATHTSGHGFYSRGSHSCTYINNTANANTDHGFYLDDSDYPCLDDCTIENNGGHGIFVDMVDGFELIDNRITANSKQGIHLAYCANGTVKNNSLFGNSLSIVGSLKEWEQVVADNTVNGKPLGYFRELRNAKIDGTDFGQILLLNCHNTTVSDAVFNDSGNVQLAYCTDCTVTNSTVAGSSYYGFRIEKSPNSTLEGNRALNCTYVGFFVTHSPDSTLIENHAISGESGGFFLILSPNCILNGNFAFENGYDGFAIHEGTGCIISLNNASSNSNAGFSIQYSYSCDVTQNFARNNSKDGFLLNLREGVVSKNIAAYNQRYGMKLEEGSSNNQIYLNRLGFNTHSDGFDDGDSNIWEKDKLGNYWAGYSGGIYSIEGTAGSIDEHPFDFHRAKPVVSPQNDVEYYYNTTGHYLNWIAWDWDCKSFRIFYGYTPILSGSWNGSSIILDINGLDVGIHRYTLIVYDQENNFATDTVEVVVKYPPDMTPGILPMGTLRWLFQIMTVLAAVTVISILAIEYFEKR